VQVWDASGSAGLAARANQHLVDAHVRRLADRVQNRVRDVLRRQWRNAGEDLLDLLAHLRSVVAWELGRDRPGLDQRDPHPEAHPLLAQRLREGADAELGEVVDARALAR